MDLWQALSYSFLQNALFASLCVGIVCPIVGVFVLMKRYSMIADTLGHVSLTGVAIGLLAGLPPMLTTVVYSLASAVSIDLLRAGKRTPSDATLSLFLSGNLALAILLLNLSWNFGTNLHASLFGSILTVRSADVWALAGLVVGVLACVFFFYRQILVVCMDSDYAAAQGIPVRYVDLGLVLLISLTVTASLPVVGLLLVWALLVLPVLAAAQIARDLRQTAYLAVGISLSAMLTGILLSFFLDIPPSATVTLLLVGAFGILKWAARLMARAGEGASAP